jgi:phage shock protein PspC (stress-responsive transcriptional regulator)
MIGLFSLIVVVSIFGYTMDSILIYFITHKHNPDALYTLKFTRLLWTFSILFSAFILGVLLYGL